MYPVSDINQSKNSIRQSPSQSAMLGSWELLCICVEQSDYWRAVSECNTHPDVQQPSKASPEVCQEEESLCVCVCACLSMCVFLSLQEVDWCVCRSIIISCSRTGVHPTVTQLKHTQMYTQIHAQQNSRTNLFTLWHCAVAQTIVQS